MFSYRLKSIKHPSAFCCEKVNKPVCLGQLSIYSSLKKKASSIIPVLVVLSFFFKDLFCNDLLILQSGKTLSAKMHNERNERGLAAAVLEESFSGPYRVTHPKGKPACSPEGCLLTRDGIRGRC